MGSSTVSVQNVVDYLSTMAALQPVISTGGFTTLPAVRNANLVMNDMLAKPFNWKWNSFNVAPFYTISWQNDYWGINNTTIGWLESCEAIDINNTALPKPMYYPEVVRHIERDSWASSPPDQVCWLYNSQLYPGTWPGNSIVYTNPLGAASTPNNDSTNILDTNGNMLVLTTYGTTAATGDGPAAAVNAATGTTVTDGSCIWTVANPLGQGFRLGPLPPQTGVVYQMNLVAQAKPIAIANLQAKINPIPDEYQNYFIDGMFTYAHKISPDPAMSAKFPTMLQLWKQSMFDACKQGDRERDAACFVPQSSIMGNDMYGSGSMGPADPYNWAQRRRFGG
jgi:hypothetical protein